MDSIELRSKATLLWETLFSIKNQDKSKYDQILMIEKIISVIAQEERRAGKNSILNHFEIEIKDLRK